MVEKRKYIGLVILFSIFLVSTPTISKESKEEILAKVGNRVITVGEFLERSELTVRPNNFKDKNTTLNNLIVEKLLALEAERDKKSISKREACIVQGIKEQAMRLKLQEEVALKKVKLDSSEIAKSYRLSNREYEVEFFTVRNRKIANEIKAILDTMPELSDEIFKKVGEIIGKRPKHKVTYLDPDDEAINKALFSELLDVGKVVGPIALANGDFIVMKICDWSERVVFGGQEELERWNKVQKKLFDMKSKELWNKYQEKVMRGKTIRFDKNTFKFIADKAMQYYIKEQGKTDSSFSAFRTDELSYTSVEINDNTPFFSIDNKVWTVGDFKKELMVRPLLYRTTKLDTSNFYKEFRNAVIDLVRDHYLTKEAYKKKLDKNKFVKRTEVMWRDSFLSEIETKHILHKGADQGFFEWGNNVSKLKYWESYLNDLQKKYSDVIEVNHDIFKKITLTKIDMVAWYPGAPYPMAVPNFPFYYASSDLSYIKNRQ